MHPNYVVCLCGAVLLSACDADSLTSNPNRERAKVTAARAGVMQIDNALQIYRLDNQRYPSQSEGLEILVTGGDGGRPVLQELAADPWGNPYQYRNPGENGEIDVFSYGRDGAPGGDGFDADVGNWE